MHHAIHTFLLLTITLALLGCAATPTTPPAASPASANTRATLRLATTTSTADTGLLDALLPEFEKTHNTKVAVIAVGTGQALEIGRKGDADVLLVHARAQEDQFVSEGHAKARFDVMYNDFIIVGPKNDPAKAASQTAAKEALKAIMDAQALFVSRGDRSGTHTKELSLWATASVTPTKEMQWYNAIGQGMGETLLFANEKQGYTLTDRGTYLAMRDKLADLKVVVGGDKLSENQDRALLNPYGVMAIDPVKHPGVKFDLAMKFVDWLMAVDTQKKIGAYGMNKFGQPLFHPDSAKWKAAPK